MRAVVQRALGASVTVDGSVVGAFEGPGLVVLLGVTHEDTPAIAQQMAEKLLGLRIFDPVHDLHGRLPDGTTSEVSAADLGLPVLLISQFTLYADTRKGRRPSWNAAAPGDVAEPIVEACAAHLRSLGATVAQGRFGADMKVALTNDGPMTIVVELPLPA